MTSYALEGKESLSKQPHCQLDWYWSEVPSYQYVTRHQVGVWKWAWGNLAHSSSMVATAYVTSSAMVTFLPISRKVCNTWKFQKTPCTYSRSHRTKIIPPSVKHDAHERKNHSKKKHGDHTNLFTTSRWTCCQSSWSSGEPSLGFSFFSDTPPTLTPLHAATAKESSI